MTAQIKICGIATPAALDAAIGARADYVGFVFYPSSPRHVDFATASLLATQSGSTVRRVGLFVDADDATIGAGIEAGRLDIVQLHGEEPPERVAQISRAFGVPVWKAVPVATASDVEKAARYRDIADCLLFDARTPAGAALPGGMGLRFDWRLIAGWSERPSWGLAGGLTPDNVAQALALTKAPLVDTSSGVETAPGQKDVDRIAAFCEAVRKA